ncbi:MAG: diaminobutyrate--2-oxoglutarate transaminase [Sandaracinaceae bacterium]
MNPFTRYESEVRSYCRNWPAVFTRARGAVLESDSGRSYLDFFAGAGALNYGHNHPHLKEALLAYLTADGVTHSLDMHTEAKGTFLRRFYERILEPRGMGHFKTMFPGPTGTNAVEAALKLARKVTDRPRVVSFTNGFHGMTLGSLAVTGNAGKRAGAGVPLAFATSVPFAGYHDDVDSLALLEQLLDDRSSGLDKPAAVILETVQAEGGVNVASAEWLRGLRALTEAHGVLLVVDDIQTGCGRTGAFFSFEEAGIVPDILTLSKSLSGYGLPFAVTCFRPELDVWSPGEHNGTFRGHNPAFVTAAAATDLWVDDQLQRDVERRASMARTLLTRMAARHPSHVLEHRGRGLIQGLEMAPGLASAVSRRSFDLGVLIETAGAQDQVLKLLCPLTIEDRQLAEGLERVGAALDAAVASAEGERQAPRTDRTSRPPAQDGPDRTVQA